MASKATLLKYHKVQIFKGERNSLGAGSFGSVYRAKCDQLFCAAKILHPTLFQQSSSETTKLKEQFQQECMFLGEMKHPNIVQFLGMVVSQKTGMPILLMELLDENLTTFLDRSPQQLQYSVEVDLCYDVSLAIAYLHSNDIMHRDLSSNNVLIVAGKKAKVSDFGMSKLIQSSSASSQQSQTYCPGTAVYMPPEALKEPPIYSNKIDCFSLGPLFLQILTHLFPQPGPRTKEIPNTFSPTGSIEIPVLETERRMHHVELVNKEHLLLAIVLKCLQNDPQQRPSADEICCQLEKIKLEESYLTNRKQLEVSSNITLANPLRQISERIQTQEQRLQTLETNHKTASKYLFAANAELRELTRALQDLDLEYKKVTGKLEEHEKLVANLQHTIDKKDEQIKEFKRQLQKPELEKFEKANTGATKEASTIQLKWIQKTSTPVQISSNSSCTRKDELLYILDGKSQNTLIYNTKTKHLTSAPDCPQCDSSLVCINNIPTAVGGRKDLAYTNNLISLFEDGPEKSWINYFPPMLTKRSHSVTACWQDKLIVAGGSTKNNIPSDTVEVMNIDTKQWFVSQSLPFPIYTGSAAINKNTLYIASHQGERSQVNKLVVACSLEGLSKTHTSEILWYTTSDLPAYYSTLISVGGHLLGVGGTLGGKRKEIYHYSNIKDSWEVMSKMKVARSSCIVGVVDCELIVLGGSTDEGQSKQVEVARIIMR